MRDFCINLNLTNSWIDLCSVNSQVWENPADLKLHHQIGTASKLILNISHHWPLTAEWVVIHSCYCFFDTWVCFFHAQEVLWYLCKSFIFFLVFELSIVCGHDLSVIEDGIPLCNLPSVELFNFSVINILKNNVHNIHIHYECTWYSSFVVIPLNPVHSFLLLQCIINSCI